MCTRCSLKRGEAATLSNKVVTSGFHIVLSVGALNGRSTIPVHGDSVQTLGTRWKRIYRIVLLYGVSFRCWWSSTLPDESRTIRRSSSPRAEKRVLRGIWTRVSIQVLRMRVITDVIDTLIEASKVQVFNWTLRNLICSSSQRVFKIIFNFYEINY